MSEATKHSEACCKIPPVTGDDYSPKGKYIDLNGTRTYVTGPDNATVAILSIYDIFGYYPQTLQGADILAHSDSNRPYQVFMPSFFGENPAPLAWYPPDTDEKKRNIGEWIKCAQPPMHLPKIPGLLEAAESTNPNIKKWGVMGYCWGGKMVSILGGQEGGKFSAGVQTSPVFADVNEAANVRIPMMVLASKDEPADEVSKYGEALKVSKHVETFGEQVHGFMSARADFKDENRKKGYERGYQLASQFFHDHIDQ